MPGSVVAEADPADRRRQVLRRNPEVTARRRTVATSSADQAIAAAIGEHEPAELEEVLAALRTLTRWLTPQSIQRLRDEL